MICQGGEEGLQPKRRGQNNGPFFPRKLRETEKNLSGGGGRGKGLDHSTPIRSATAKKGRVGYTIFTSLFMQISGARSPHLA